MIAQSQGGSRRLPCWLLTLILPIFGAGAETTSRASSANKGSGAVPLAEYPVEEAVLTSAPEVPPPITRKTPAKVVVHLEVREVTKRLADGVTYTFWTFGGAVPGKFIRVREGDVVEFHLSNHPSNKLPHNIDLHAVIGSGGGATSSFTAPGHTSQFTFTALKSGLFAYHCATSPVPMHVGNGMYGMILVEPKEGLPPVDHEYYVMQGEVYTNGRYGEEGLQSFDLAKELDERPPYIVFNGAVGSLVGDLAVQASVGQRVRIYFGNAGPNLTSSFHIIGEIFDTVYPEGGTPPLHNVQTTSVPPGCSTIVEFKAEVPGTFVLVDHALSRAFNKGALGMIKITGPENKLIYSGKEVDEVYLGKAGEKDAGKREIQSLLEKRQEAIQSNPEIANIDRELQVKRGKNVFSQTCIACHQADGKGIPNAFPPLAESDFFAADRERAIGIVLKGLSGEVVVNGNKFNSVMPPHEALLSDKQIADVLTYVASSFGNKGEPFSEDAVRKVRNEHK